MSLSREKFAKEELATCLSHYDLGIIDRIELFPRGSSRSPKVLVFCEKGDFLFKRRARGKGEIDKVRFTHQIQKHLATNNFPLPHLLELRESKETMLVIDGHVYEMFEYIEGKIYKNSPRTTADAGKMLGLYHKLLEDFRSDYESPAGSYHNAPAILQSIKTTTSAIPLDSRPSSKIVTSTINFIEEAYKLCAEKVEQGGINNMAPQVVHGDWHPGNLLYRDDKVVAVIDFDAARIQQRVIDLANGVLQFSIIGGTQCPTGWPEHVDVDRFKTFLQAYDKQNVISAMELKIIPYLMCEAIIAEGVLPIAATGSFGKLNGFDFLQMIERKVRWMLKHIKDLRAVIH